MKLPGEGETRTVRQVQMRVACETCARDATRRYTYLLKGNARGNPASSAFGRDDCSWCSDKDQFKCDECPRTEIPGYEWCGTFTACVAIAHMFLKWKEISK